MKLLASLSMMRAIIMFWIFTGLALTRGQVPQMVNVQGRVSVAGKNLTGIGLFRFALVNSTDSTKYWTNSPDVSPADGVPDKAVQLSVRGGIYSVLLGDASIPEMSILPPSAFTNPQVWLRVWFDDGVRGVQQLSPDQRIAAVGYALMAGNVADGAVTSSKLASSLDLSAKALTLPADVTRLGSSVDLSTETSGNLSTSKIAFAGTSSQLLAGDGSTFSIGKGLATSGGAIKWDESADFQPSGTWDWATSKNYNLLGSRITPARSPKRWASLLAAGVQTQTGARAKMVIVGDSIANTMEIVEAVKMRIGVVGVGNGFGSDYSAHPSTFAGGANVVSGDSTLTYTGSHAILPAGGSITIGNVRPLHKIWLSYTKEPGAGNFAIEWQAEGSSTWNRLGETSANHSQLDSAWISYDETNTPILYDDPTAPRKRWRILHTGGGTVRLLAAADATWQDDATTQRSGAVVLGIDKSGRAEAQWKLVNETLARSFWQGFAPDIVMVLTRPGGSPDASEGVTDFLTKIKQWVPNCDVVYVSAPPYMDGLLNPETGANYDLSPGTEAYANETDRVIGSHVESIGGYWVDLDPFFEPRSDLNQLYGYFDKIGQPDDGIHLGTVGQRIQAGLIADALFPISQSTFATNAAGQQQETMAPYGTVTFRNPMQGGVTLALRSADAFSNNGIAFGSHQNVYLAVFGSANAAWSGSFVMGTDNAAWNFFGVKSRIGNYTSSSQPSSVSTRHTSGQLEVFGTASEHTLVVSTLGTKSANRYHITVAESTSDTVPGSFEDFAVGPGGRTFLGGNETSWTSATSSMLTILPETAATKGISIQNTSSQTAPQIVGYADDGSSELWRVGADGSLTTKNLSTAGSLTVGSKTVNSTTPACRWRGAFGDPPSNPLPGDIYRDTNSANQRAAGGYIFTDTDWQKLW